MLVVRVIKKLQAAAAYLKGAAIKRKMRKLEAAAEEIDAQEELAIKRVQFSLDLQAKLEQRAYEKLEQGVDRANADKQKAGSELDELNSL